MHQRIDWDVFGLNSFVVPFECSIIYHSIKMSANVFFFYVSATYIWLT